MNSISFPTEATTPETKTFTNVTLYAAGAFGYSKTECRSLTVTPGPYAQHAHALHVVFLEKGKRKARGFVKAAGSPCFVVVEGFGHPSPADAFRSTGDGGSITRHSCFSAEWGVEFDAWFAASGKVAVFDGRGGA